MVKREKTRSISLTERSGAFNTFFKRLAGEHKEVDVTQLAEIRSLLSAERARLIHLMKLNRPSSIYDLAQKAQRPYKAVLLDCKLLVKYGIIELIPERKGKRHLSKPVVVLDALHLTLRF
jgi:predicted transcriptional regulator